MSEPHEARITWLEKELELWKEMQRDTKQALDVAILALKEATDGQD